MNHNQLLRASWRCCKWSLPFHMSKAATSTPRTPVISKVDEMATDPDFSGVEDGVTTTVPESLDGVGAFTSGTEADGDSGAVATQINK